MHTHEHRIRIGFAHTHAHTHLWANMTSSGWISVSHAVLLINIGFPEKLGSVSLSVCLRVCVFVCMCAHICCLLARLDCKELNIKMVISIILSFLFLVKHVLRLKPICLTNPTHMHQTPQPSFINLTYNPAQIQEQKSFYQRVHV